MVNSGPDPTLQKVLIGERRPPFPDRFDFRFGRLQSFLSPVRIRPFDGGLRTQSGGRDLPRARHDVAMMVALIAVSVRRMDRKIHRHPIPIRELSGERSDELDPL